jgi:hypothetical protein
MKISINGAAKDVTSTNLAAVLHEAGYRDARVATAVNGNFVPVGPTCVMPDRSWRSGGNCRAAARRVM